MFYEIQADSEDTLNVFCHDTTSIDPHFHSSIEFVYVLDGNMDFFFNGTHTVLGADDMYAVPSWQPHGNSSVGNNRICSVVFSVNFMKFFRKDHPNEFSRPFFPTARKTEKFSERSSTIWLASKNTAATFLL